MSSSCLVPKKRLGRRFERVVFAPKRVHDCSLLQCVCAVCCVPCRVMVFGFGGCPSPTDLCFFFVVLGWSKSAKSCGFYAHFLYFTIPCHPTFHCSPLIPARSVLSPWPSFRGMHTPAQLGHVWLAFWGPFLVPCVCNYRTFVFAQPFLARARALLNERFKRG